MTVSTIARNGLLVRLLKNILVKNSFSNKVIGSIFTQCLLSAANLCIGLLLIRLAPKDEYGLYIVCFAIIQIFISIQNAMVNSPLTVILPEKNPGERSKFVQGLATGQWIFLAPLLIVFGMGLAVNNFFFTNTAGGLPLWALLFAIPSFYFKEFIRVLNYIYLYIGRIIFIDVIFVGSVLLGLTVCVGADYLDAKSVVFTLGFASLVSAFVGHSMTGRIYSPKAKPIREAYGDTWRYSRWALLGILVTNIQTYSYVFIVSSMLGLKDIADINAARLFFMPFGLVITSSQRILIAKGAQTFADCQKKFAQLLFGFVTFFVIAWAAYFALVFLASDFVVKHVFTAKYINITNFILLWGVFFLFNSLAFIIIQAMQVIKKFKKLSLLNGCSSLIMLCLCILLTRSLGPIGSLYAVIAGEVCFILLAGPQLVRFIYSVKDS
jgi:O-antigen/teichoic acid export membrane protein